MTFSQEVWQKRVIDKTQQVRHWAEQAEATPYPLYSTLVGLALSPLLEAYQVGHIIPVITTLGDVASDEQSNYLAAQLPQWQPVSTPVESRLITWVTRQLVQAAMRQLFETILSTLEVITETQKQLTPADQTWFKHTLTAELTALQNRPQPQYNLTGSGAMAIGDGATAVGERGMNVQSSHVDGSIITGTVHTQGDFVGGDKKVIHHAPASLEPIPPLPIPLGLRQQMIQCFNLSELENLCHNLTIDLEQLPGTIKQDKVNNLIALMQRQGRLSSLLEQCRRERPHLKWDF